MCREYTRGNMILVNFKTVRQTFNFKKTLECCPTFNLVHTNLGKKIFYKLGSTNIMAHGKNNVNTELRVEKNYLKVENILVKSSPPMCTEKLPQICEVHHLSLQLYTYIQRTWKMRHQEKRLFWILYLLLGELGALR